MAVKKREFPLACPYNVFLIALSNLEVSVFKRIALLIVLFSVPLAFSQAKHPITFEDMMKLKRVGDPVVSPDGKWVLFNAMDVDLDANTRKPHIWIIPAAGGEARMLTDEKAGEQHARFSPSGKRILFHTTKDGSQQVWLWDFDATGGKFAGEPKKLTNLSTEADGAMWSPDDKNIVFVSEVYPDCMVNDDACNAAKDEAAGKSKVKAKIFTRLLFRHWNSYSNGKRSHLFVVNVETGKTNDITPGDYATPPFSLGGQDDYAISPDGKEIAFTSNHEDVEAASTNNDIFIVSITGGVAKQISTSKGSDSTPLYSPDGKWLAWRMQVRNGYESDRFRLVVMDRATGAITNLTERFDQWVGTFAWAPDSKSIYFSSESKGEAPIYRVPVVGGDVKQGPSKTAAAAVATHPVKEIIRGHDDELNLTADGKFIIFTKVSVERPNEVYRLALKADGTADGKAEQLTHMNDAVFAGAFTSPIEPFWFTGAEQTKVEGFIVKPPDFDAKKKWPVKFLIHGGPQGAWGDSWSFRWNAQMFAANGYVVVQVNPRGSTGYGQRFIDEINGDWGGRPYQDLMMGLDAALAKYPYLDKDRVCAMGASYGGYMVNWIMGHTNRFKCAVSHDGMFNTESAYGQTEELWFNEWEFKGMPWTNQPIYRQWSPHLSATKFKTPTLVVHSQLDYRLDVSQGFDLFTTLQRLKVPSKMLYFPDEGHWVLKPQNSRLWYKTVNEWVDQYLKK